MKRTKLHALNPETAQKRISAAKSNKPFMTALLDRAHPEHEEAVGQWTKLHEIAFREPDDRPSPSDHDRANRSSRVSSEATLVDGTSRRRLSDGRSGTTTRENGSARRTASAAQKPDPRKTRSRKQQVNASRRGAGQMEERQRLPDPEQPLNVDQRAISELLQRPGESDSDWAKRLLFAAREVQMSVDQLMVVREAILQGIGFYDVGSGAANSDGELTETDWRVLAVLQNLPFEGWERAERMDEARAEFERRGTLGFSEVIGPDGGLYHRPSIRGSNPVGDVLQTIDGRIRLMQPPSSRNVLSTLPLIRLTNPSRQGGTPPRGPLAANVAPRVLQVIRSQRGPAAIGLGIALAGGTALQRRGRSEMEAAPNLPPTPGLEPPEDPETERESFPADLPPIPPLPGFMPEDYPDLFEIFPDQRGKLPLVDILDRWGSPETQLFNSRTMQAVRDLAMAIGVDVRHLGGGRPNDQSDYAKEHWLSGPNDGTVGSSYLDIAFQSKHTGRKLLINTIDTRADNATPSTREERAAVRILENSETGDILILLPKPPRGQTYDPDRFLEWLRPHLEEIDRDLPEGSAGHQRRFDFH